MNKTIVFSTADSELIMSGLKTVDVRISTSRGKRISKFCSIGDTFIIKEPFYSVYRIGIGDSYFVNGNIICVGDSADELVDTFFSDKSVKGFMDAISDDSAYVVRENNAMDMNSENARAAIKITGFAEKNIQDLSIDDVRGYCPNITSISDFRNVWDSKSSKSWASNPRVMILRFQFVPIRDVVE